ncbi:hypothetical protein O9G_005610 [Rozella allomycis CSF55]|uniref:Uncharacterized protein n=1 Tax=Rozella allomycis (strain CSF55) TaxID=988480 RepID=A0A075AU88_ROZAC|nr:hypothetical protein O9G_005610 [Rozella allomycis CSF55]|eukprot:EPZ33833.1 hypothetical protein O9G_005610 [Rozella allomycis CSF55]
MMLKCAFMDAVKNMNLVMIAPSLETDDFEVMEQTIYDLENSTLSYPTYIESADEEIFDDVKPSISMTEVKHKIDKTPVRNYIYAPVLLNNPKVEAGIDSMSTHSFITPNLVSELNLKFTKVDGSIGLASAGASCKRIGYTEEVKVIHGGVTIYHAFEIMNLNLK